MMINGSLTGCLKIPGLLISCLGKVRATDAKEVGVRNPAEENVPPPGPNPTVASLEERFAACHRTDTYFPVSGTPTQRGELLGYQIFVAIATKI
jgi:hypothetical protein